MTKIAIISDIHHGTDRGSKLGSSAKELVTTFLEWAEAEDCKLIVDLGDRISDVDNVTDMQLQKEVAAWFRSTSIPLHQVNGNHDVDFLDQAQLAEAVGRQVVTSTTEIGGYNLVFWCGSARLDPQKGFNSVSQSEIDALGEAVLSSNLPAIVFSHVPLYRPSFFGNFYFENFVPHLGCYPDHTLSRIRGVIERSERIVACINGHAHWNSYHTADGVHYFTVPSLTESFATYPDPNAAWSLLTLNGPNLNLKVVGKTPIEYSIPIKQPLSHHWLSVDKDYSPARITPE